jgi:hypothetical protein
VKAGRIELLKVAGSLSPKGGVRAGTIKSLSTGKHLRGKVVASGRLSRLNVGGALSGSVGVSKAANRLEIGGSLKRTGVVTAAQVNTLTVGGTLAGKVAVGGELKHITIHADLTGSVSESRGIESIFIGGSFTRTGVLRLLREPRRELPRVAIGGDVKGTVISTSAPRSAAVVRKPQNLGRRPARRRGLLSLLASQDWRGPPPTLQDDDWEHIRKRHWPGTEHTEPNATKFEGTYLVATTGRFASLNRGELVNLIAVTCATGFTRWTWNRIECQKKYDWIVGVQRNGDFCKYLWVVVRRHPNTVETAYPICKRKLKEDGGPDG